MFYRTSTLVKDKVWEMRAHIHRLYALAAGNGSSIFRKRRLGRLAFGSSTNEPGLPQVTLLMRGDDVQPGSEGEADTG